MRKSENSNKFIVKKKTSKDTKSRGLTLPLWLQSFANKLGRRKHGGVGKISLSPLRLLKSISKERFRIVLILGSFLFISLIIVVGLKINERYSQIQLEPYLDGEIKPIDTFRHKTKNIAFINFERVDESNIFAKFIEIISYDNSSKDLKVLSVEPSLLTYYKNKPFTLANLFNNLDSEEKSLDRYLNNLEEVLGVRLDGYLVTESDLYADFILENNFSVRLEEDFKIDNIFYKRGELLYGDNYLSYLGLGRGSVTTFVEVNRHSRFITNTFQNQRGLLKMIENFLNSDRYMKTFFTNLPKVELIEFYNNIFSDSNLPIYQVILSSRDGYFINVPFGQALTINRIDIDNKVQSVFRDLEIVKEAAKIEVLNASGVSGLASVKRKIIQNSGGNVVNFGNFPLSTIDKTTLYLVDTPIKDIPNTILLIKSMYPEVVIKTEGYEYNHLGNVILVLGGDNNTL